MFRPLLFVCLLGVASAATKLALIGDSITAGQGAGDPKTEGYPAQLQLLLGDDYDVRSFAIGGHTLVRKGKHPLMKTRVYQKALEFQPDVAVIVLGTNDSNSSAGNHWQFEADLEADLLAMIGDLKQSNPAVLIHVAGPPPLFPDKKGLSPERVAILTERRARLAEIRRRFAVVAGKEPQVLAHDLSRGLITGETTDGVHPTTVGHRRLAEHFAGILSVGFDEKFVTGKKLEAFGVTVKSAVFHGFDRYDFKMPAAESAGILVAPKQAADGRPWVLRARFFGHQPGLDLELLDRGWHVAYCDVSNLYGSETAMVRWDSAYDFLVGKVGLAPRVVLEGMSRGGLPIFHWAARHPERVAAVYGDNPVCDFRTWPGGHGGKGSKGDWQRLLKVWNLDEATAMEHPQVVDCLEPIAKGGIPVALVLGMVDKVVPPGANGEPVAAKLQEMGGTVRVWRKPGDGHHPHGLHPPGPLREFLLEAYSKAGR